MYGLIHKNTMVYSIAGLISLLLSLWITTQQSVINSDAICYLTSAAHVKFGLHTAMHVCSQAEWPFYSVLIYGVANFTKLSYESSAYLLNALFSLISVLTFISIIGFITQKPRVLWLAAMVILLSHEFNAVRDYIIRDHGFWAFYLLSVFFLLHYFRQHQWRYALAWNISTIIAALFRVEGVMFLLFIPFLVWLYGRQAFSQRFLAFLRLNTMTLIGVVILLGWIALHPQFDLTRLHEVQFQLTHGFGSMSRHFVMMKQNLAHYVIGQDGAHDAGVVLFLMIAVWYFLNVALNLSLIYSVLVAYAWIKKLLATEKFVHLILWGYIVLNILITAAFLAEHMFLSKRYLIALTLILMIWVPFALEKLLQQWPMKKWPAIIAFFFIIISSLGGIFDFGYSKKYLHDAGDWLTVNVPPQASLYSNDNQVMYYSNHYGDSLFQKMDEFANPDSIKQWKRYDYLAIRMSKDEVKSNQITYPLVHVFSNKRGDQVRIYQRGAL